MNGKKNLTLFTGDMIVYVDNPKKILTTSISG